MKTIRWTSMTLILMFSLLSNSVMGARGEVRTESYSAPTQQVKDSSLIGVRVAPANEDFTVWMPDSPQLVGAEQLVIDQRPLILRYYGHIQGGTEFAVLSVSGLEDRRGDLAHMLMLNLYSKLIPTSLLKESEKSEVAIKANYQRDISLNGYVGREFSIQAHKRTGLWRFYSVGRKFYAVAVSTSERDNNLINRFLDSFTLGAPTSAINQNEPVQPQPNIGAQGTLPARSSSTIIQNEPVQPQPNISGEGTLPARPLSTEIQKEPVQSQANISAQGTLPARPSSTETWFIILSTFSKTERPKANQRMLLFRSLGYDAHLVDTDSYPNLRKGLLAVAIGPHSKSAALGYLNKVRSVAPGSYIKPGW